jgi:hypothetical protein
MGMKVGTVVKSRKLKILSILIACSLIMCSTTSVFAGADFIKEGKKYQIVEMNGPFAFVLILKAPDERGWAKVKILGGSNRYSKMKKEKWYINLSHYILAEELVKK